MSGPHDALFKHIFSQPEHAASELRAVLPAGLCARLDWSSLELEPSSFVDEQLRGRQADLLFSVRCQGRAAYLYILFEHQSTSGALMAFRLLRYMTRIWDAFLLANPPAERLPVIIPVVLHHSDRGWRLNSARCSTSTRRRSRSLPSTFHGFDSCSTICRAPTMRPCADGP